jgi:hypothetical protein
MPLPSFFAPEPPHRHGQPQRTGAGQQRRDIHPHFGEQDHRRDGADNDRQRVTE